jgi:DNA-binding Lrp family transcriptional regulator
MALHLVPWHLAAMLDVVDLDPLDQAAYRALLRSPRLGGTELAVRLHTGQAEVDAALARLAGAGLLRRTRAGWRPVRPDRALGPLLDAAEVAVEERRRSLGTARQELADLVADYLSGRERGGGDLEVEVLEGLVEIRARIDQLLAATRTEVLTVSTALEDEDEESVAAARRQDLPLLERGVSVRSVLPRRLHELPLLWAYAEETSAAGEQIRLADELPPRMVVRDREVAVLPLDADDPRAGVLVVWSQSLVVALVRLFEEVWQRGRPLVASPTAAHDHDPRLLALLAAGAKDESIARQLGRGLRTVRRDVAVLLEELGASTRFEAGVAAARRGWL